MSRADELRQRLMGAAEPEAGSAATPAAPPPPATHDTEEGSQAEPKPLTMNEILRGRVKRHVDLFGQPTDETPTTAETPPSSDMNQLIRSQVRRSRSPMTKRRPPLNSSTSSR